MATYSNNTTIKIGSAVTISGATSYTVPNNCYLIIWYVSTSGSTSVGPQSFTGNVLFDKGGLIVPAGTQIIQSNKGDQTRGTLFQNTP